MVSASLGASRSVCPNALDMRMEVRVRTAGVVGKAGRRVRPTRAAGARVPLAAGLPAPAPFAARDSPGTVARVHLFADEAGNFDFSRNAGASRFFILTTVAFPEGHDALATSLRALRFELAWEGVDFRREFHATDDTQAVRDRVCAYAGSSRGARGAHDFRVDATILEKPKARPAIRRPSSGSTGQAWAFHLRNVLPTAMLPGDDHAMSCT